MKSANTPIEKAADSPRSQRLQLEKLRLDGETQPRHDLDDEVVDEYAHAYLSGAKFPPIVVFFDGREYWLADGFHRWHASQKAGQKDIACEIHNGSVGDARWFSYSVNQAHGLRRSNGDKQRAVQAALQHPNGVKLSDGRIAEHVGVSVNMVGKYRKELKPTMKVSESPTRTGRDGRATNTANIGNRKSSEVGKAKSLSPVSPPTRAPVPPQPPDQETTVVAGEVQFVGVATEPPCIEFDLPEALCRLENAVFAQLAKWPDELKPEAARRLQQLAKECVLLPPRPSDGQITKMVATTVKDMNSKVKEAGSVPPDRVHRDDIALDETEAMHGAANSAPVSDAKVKSRVTLAGTQYEVEKHRGIWMFQSTPEAGWTGASPEMAAEIDRQVCPRGGRHEPDADGDCSKCGEPGVVNTKARP